MTDTVAMLVFSMTDFWKSSIVEFTVDEKYNRWWKRDNQCTLLWGDEDCAPIILTFDESTGMCTAEGDEENEVDLSHMNIIIERIMCMLTGSIKAYQAAKYDSVRGTSPHTTVRGSSRSMSVSPSGKMKNRSDVYRRALIKLDEMREAGTLSKKDYEAGRQALAKVAIDTAS